MIRINKNTSFGLIITLSGSLLYVIFGVLSKHIQYYLEFNTLIFLQSIAGFFVSLVFLYCKKFKWVLLWKDFHLFYCIRILVSLVSMYTYIYGLKFVGVYNALVILNFSPFLMPFLRFLLFKQKIRAKIYAVIFVAFIGIIFILKPDHSILNHHMYIIVISMVCMAFSILLLEHKSNANLELSIFYYFLFGTLISACALPHTVNLGSLQWRYAGFGMLTGILFFLVQLSVLYAARYISSQLISILFYSEVIFALLVSIVAGAIQFNWFLVIGTMLILLGGAGVVYFE